MKTTIDKAGRLVIPKNLREQLGLVPGEVMVSADGGALRVEPTSRDDLVEENGRLVIPASGMVVDDAMIDAMRDADRR